MAGVNPIAAYILDWEYEVLVERKAYLEAVQCHLIRTVDSTVTGAAWCGVTLDSPTAAVAAIGILTMHGTDNERFVAKATICDKATGATNTNSFAGASILMMPGDVLRGYHANGAIDGKVEYTITGKLTEFDY